MTYYFPTADCQNRINQNAKTSPLLRIPGEVRELIWRAAIGDRTFHIKHLDQDQLKTLQRHQTHPDSTRAEGAFRYIQCTAILSEDEAYEASKLPSKGVPSGEDPTCYVQSCKSRHSSCYSLGNGTFGKQVWVRLFEHVDSSVAERDRVTICSLLGASRQIYQEGYRLFWITNTFSFDDPYSLGEFLGSLTLSQKRHLTKLHVVRRWYQMEQVWSWQPRHYATMRNVLGLLQGLKTFHLCIEQRTRSARFDPQYRNMASRDEGLVDGMCQPWPALRTSPLANVTVIISDKRTHLQQNNLLMDRCTVAEKNWAAEKIRESLTNEEAVAQARQEMLQEKVVKNELKKLHKARKMLRGEGCTTESTSEQTAVVSKVRSLSYPGQFLHQLEGPFARPQQYQGYFQSQQAYGQPAHSSYHQINAQQLPLAWHDSGNQYQVPASSNDPRHQTRQKYPWENRDEYQRNQANDSFDPWMSGTSEQQQEQEPKDTLPPQHSADASEASYHVSDQAQQQNLTRQPVDDTYQASSLRNNHTQHRNPLYFFYPGARRTDSLVPIRAGPVNVDQSLARENQVLSRHQVARRHMVEERAHKRFSPYSRPARQQQAPRAVEEKGMGDALLYIEEDTP